MSRCHWLRYHTATFGENENCADDDIGDQLKMVFAKDILYLNAALPAWIAMTTPNSISIFLYCSYCVLSVRHKFKLLILW